MPLEMVLIIIMGVATAGHISAPEHSGIHSVQTEREYEEDFDAEVLRQCIAEAKESFEYGERDSEELVGHIETECYTDAD